MMMMIIERDIADIIELIKDHLSASGIKSGKVFDAYVARQIDMDPVNLAAYKTRNTIPYKNILRWCAENGIDPVEIFYREGQ